MKMADQPSSITAGHLCGMMQALSHKHRLSIIDCLKDGERDVQSIQESLSLGQSTVSQHLAVMRTQKIVKERRAGRRVLYRLSQVELLEWLLKGSDLSSLMNGQPDPEEPAT
jgi:DNA-binding transcriptional ArsR family regulator